MKDKAWLLDLEMESRVMALNFGIAGASFAGVLTIGSFDVMSCWLSYSLMMFSVSAVFSVAAAMCSWLGLRQESGSPKTKIWAAGVGLSGQIPMFLGVTLLLRHHSPLHAAIFGVSVAVALLIWFRFGQLALEAKQELIKTKQNS